MEVREEFAKEEGLHQAIVIKLSNGALNLEFLRTLLPKIFGVKGNSLLGLLAQRQLLLRLDQYEDFVIVLVRSVNYFSYNGKEHQVRIFPCTIGFNPNEETSMAAVWISLPSLSPDLFARRSLLSIVAAVGRPNAVDKATQVRSRPSTDKVRVIVDLLVKLRTKLKFKVSTKKREKLLMYCRRWCMIICRYIVLIVSTKATMRVHVDSSSPKIMRMIKLMKVLMINTRVI